MNTNYKNSGSASSVIGRGISAAECEFLAENELIKINPTFKQRELQFISGTFGPFEPYVPVSVPLWLAVTLRRKNKCRIAIPEWMSIDWLEERIARERVEDKFTEVPFHYIEISTILLDVATEEIVNKEKISMLLRDLESIRMDRARLGINVFATNVEQRSALGKLTTNNIASMEIFTINDFLRTTARSFTSFVDTKREIVGSSSAPPPSSGAADSRGSRKLSSSYGDDEEEGEDEEEELGRNQIRRFRR